MRSSPRALSRHGLLWTLVGAVVLLQATACALKPLRTPIREPSRSCSATQAFRVGLFGFDDSSFDQLGARLAALIADSGFPVQRFDRRKFFEKELVREQVDVGILLEDGFSHVRSNATARQRTFVYFTVTVLAAWMIPILQGTDLFVSSVTIEAEFAAYDFRGGTSLWESLHKTEVREKPTGYLGPGDAVVHHPQQVA